jgi:dTDP-4-amino-4,6-dideoxygalactose transaminase
MLFKRKNLPLKLPIVAKDNKHVFNQYVIRTPARNELIKFLKEKGVSTDIYYPLPLHLQECFGYLGYKRGDLPKAELASEEVLALPIYPELTAGMQEYVVEMIEKFFIHQASGA